jgi:hypothetical protein
MCHFALQMADGRAGSCANCFRIGICGEHAVAFPPQPRVMSAVKLATVEIDAGAASDGEREGCHDSSRLRGEGFGLASTARPL